jgi:aminoglycoside phosphotransferase (APT) family kinase protein
MGGGGSFRVHEWVDLEPEGHVTTRELARTVAALHAADLPADPEPEPWFGRGVPAVQWDGLVAAGRAAGEPWAEDLAAAVPEFGAMAEWVTEDDPATLRMCHRDISTRNVRRTPAGEVVVLDWENCGPADPVRELAVLLVVHAMVTDPGQAPLLYGAYCDLGGPARIRGLADFSAAARGQAELVRLYVEQALDDRLPAADRQFARERLAWMLPPRVTVVAVARLVEGLTAPR